VVAAVAMIAATACARPALSVDETVATQEALVRVQTVATGLVNPWAIAFLPDGRALVTERPGRLRVLAADGSLSAPLGGVPEVFARDQGGLLDVVLDPDFANNRWVYLSYAEPGEGDTNGTAVMRGRLAPDAGGLQDTEVIFRQQPQVDSTKHFGSRLVFDGDGHLYVTLGERSDRAWRDQAQDLDSHLGKIVRLFPDGSVPSDNPFTDQPGALPEIWSYGHRNIQAAAMNPATGQLWEIEHGPRGGDELNIVEPGANYGWPLVSHGVNYIGTPVGTGERTMEGVTDPIYTWTPVIAPSGMIFYTGDAFPAWQGDLFVGGLASTALVRLELDGERVVDEERLMEAFDRRIRDVAQAPDGSIYVVTDHSDASVVRLSPVE
jgi:glucose/arabinose dehydrogenase